MTDQQNKYKEIAVSFANYDSTVIISTEDAYLDWLLTEEGKRLTEEPGVESPEPSLDALIEIAKSMVQMSGHQLSMKKQLDRIEGNMRLTK